MKTLKSVLFILCSVLEIHVQAKEYISLPVAKNVGLEPSECLLKSSLCSVTTGSKEKFVLTFGTNEATLGRDTVVIRESANTIHLVKGSVLVKSDKKTIVKCEFGQVVSLDGEYLVSREAGRVMVRAILSPLTIIPKGSAEELVVEPGFQNWLYKVSQSGQAQSGIPLVWDLEDIVKTWAQLYSGNKVEFRKKMRSLNGIWSQAVISASQRHKIYAERLLASAEEDRKHRAFSQKKSDEERRQIREMMIQRNHLDLF
ncbi:MAG: hypothetical protein SGJ18_07385 [Pseudomonadota bacterium]|nr:hypothetical protein [Pseudomonadota bacterium]